MTLKDLSEYRHALDALDRKSEYRAEIYARAISPAGAKLTGMPGGSGPKVSSTERYAEQLALLDEEIQRLRKDAVQKHASITQYISNIKDGRTRYMFTLRFIDGLSWAAVADEINRCSEKDSYHDISGDAVRVFVKRYLAKTEAPA